ncbi:MAG TPA: FAD-dependent oxidoreductase, partial [Nitrospirae bacterium]|nr:FAD-dependent oxidoreductase [Nitrospirota bacterium]
MKINIVGAGITGLSAAYFLSSQGHSVSVFDSAREIGGISGFFPVEGTSLEKYYHHIFSGHNELLALMNELGVGNEVYFRKTKMGFYFEGQIYPFASAKDLLSFTPLKIRDRVRLGLSSLMMMQIKDWRSMEKKSAIEWLRTYAGNEACKIVWEPLLKMKFGNDYDRISAAWLWNRVVDRKKAKGNSTEKEALGYIRGGYKILFDALMDKVKLNGGIIHTDTPVDEIIVKDGKCTGIRSS